MQETTRRRHRLWLPASDAGYGEDDMEDDMDDGGEGASKAPMGQVGGKGQLPAGLGDEDDEEADELSDAMQEPEEQAFDDEDM